MTVLRTTQQRRATGRTDPAVLIPPEPREGPPADARGPPRAGLQIPRSPRSPRPGVRGPIRAGLGQAHGPLWEYPQSCLPLATCGTLETPDAGL